MGVAFFFLFFMWHWKNISPHGAESQLVSQVCVVRQQSREEVFGKGVHGNAFSVDDFSEAAERTGWNREGQRGKSGSGFRLTRVRRADEWRAAYPPAAARPASAASGPGGRPAPAPAVWRRSALRYDTPGTRREDKVWSKCYLESDGFALGGEL